jgi:hypothetical protein
MEVRIFPDLTSIEAIWFNREAHPSSGRFRAASYLLPVCSIIAIVVFSIGLHRVSERLIYPKMERTYANVLMPATRLILIISAIAGIGEQVAELGRTAWLPRLIDTFDCGMIVLLGLAYLAAIRAISMAERS